MKKLLACLLLLAGCECLEPKVEGTDGLWVGTLNKSKASLSVAGQSARIEITYPDNTKLVLNGSVKQVRPWFVVLLSTDRIEAQLVEEDRMIVGDYISDGKRFPLSLSRGR